jgi:hypothetical protein
MAPESNPALLASRDCGTGTHFPRCRLSFTRLEIACVTSDITVRELTTGQAHSSVYHVSQKPKVYKLTSAHSFYFSKMNKQEIKQ